MAEVAVHNLKFWLDKVVNDPEMLPEDLYGKKLGDPEFKLPIFKTFCNIFIQRVCSALGCDDFGGMTANQIHDYLAMNWGLCSEKSAQDAANMGDIVIAAWKNPSPEKHGHVAIIYPNPRAPMIYSGKWKCYVPWVASVGQDCGIMGSNMAFKDKPDYFRQGKINS